MEYEFVPYYYEQGLEKDFLEKVKKLLKSYKKVGLCYLIQREKQAKMLLEFLDNAFMCGQVLGCNMSNVEKNKEKMDSFLLVGSGKFHGIEMKRLSKKPVFVAVPNSEVFEIKEKHIARMEGIKTEFIDQFNKSKEIGLLVSTKKGQFNLEKARKAKKSLERCGKNPYLFMFNTLSPENLANFSGIDFWVNFACPRVPEDYERFPKPVLNWDEIEQECD